MPKIKIIVIDDHAIVRAGLRMLINTQDDMEFIGEAMNGQTALQEAIEKKPDVAIMDITMPGTDPIKTIEEILNECPKTRVLVLTMHSDPSYVRAALTAGALGYVVKE